VTYPAVPIYRCILVRDGKAVRLPREKITCEWQAAAVIEQLTGDSPVEKLVCVYLDAGGRLIGAEVVASGAESKCAVTPASVLRGAIIHCASGIIVGHNHPSDDPTPSAADIEMTHELQRAAEVVGITLLDHVVVSHSNGHRSIRDELGDSW
jgi:DNA repair protein RadC